jgi:hypothetical protein
MWCLRFVTSTLCEATFSNIYVYWRLPYVMLRFAEVPEKPRGFANRDQNLQDLPPQVHSAKRKTTLFCQLGQNLKNLSPRVDPAKVLPTGTKTYQICHLEYTRQEEKPRGFANWDSYFQNLPLRVFPN